MKQKRVWVIIGIYVLFFLSRWFVLTHPPYYKVEVNGKEMYEGYSDVKHDYERYANMWRYGLTPYRKHLYEYPPATIPLAALALEIDQRGIGHFYINYRTQIFVFETILFSVMLLYLSRVRWSRLQKGLAVLFYISMGAIAKDFWYEGLDLIFMGTFLLALLWRYLAGHTQVWRRVVFWSFFWLSVSLKFMTAPLLVPLLFLERKQWRKEAVAFMLGFLVVWGVPLALYRSSLSVMFFFHETRPLKYESFGTFIVLAINDFTRTEVQTDIKPHLPIVGPVSTVVTKTVNTVFPLAISLVLLWSLWFIHRREASFSNRNHLLQTLLQITFVYIFTVFLTGKIFSRPFHLWYIALMTVFPFKTIKQQCMYYLSGLWMTMVDTTPWIKVSVKPWLGPVSIARMRDLTRFLPMMLLLWQSLVSPLPEMKAHKKHVNH